MRLVPPPGQVGGGEVWLQGEDLLRQTEREIESYRGEAPVNDLPASAERLILGADHRGPDHLGACPAPRHAKEPGYEEAGRILQSLGITESASRLRNYPHQLSGGMCQRVMIGMAIACNPLLLIADEPTSALDVMTQAQILDLIRQICLERGLAVLFITHDLGIFAEVCDRVIVMYAGELAEECTVFELFNDPRHPFTRGLLASVPTVNTVCDRLQGIPGQPPNLQALPRGYTFASRCPEAEVGCHQQPPELKSMGISRSARCIKA